MECRRIAAALIAAAIASGCPSPTPAPEETPDASTPDASPAPLALRPGAQEVFASYTATPGAAKNKPFVLHFSRFGSRLAALVCESQIKGNYGCSAPRLVVSEDLGAHWATHAITLASLVVDWPFAAVVGERAIYLLAQSPDAATPSAAPVSTWLVDLAADTATRTVPCERPANCQRPLPIPPDLIEGGVATMVQASGTVLGITGFTVTRFDAAAGTISTATAATSLPVSGFSQLSLGALTRVGPDALGAYRYLLASRCYEELDARTAAVSRHDCVPFRAWPIPYDAIQLDVAASGSLWRAYEDGGHVLMRRIPAASPPAVGPAVDLGPGYLRPCSGPQATGYGVTVNPGLVALADDHLRCRLIEPTQTGPVERSFHATPCADDAACPVVALDRVEALGDGKFFLAQIVQDPAEAARYHLVFRVADGAEATPLDRGAPSYSDSYQTIFIAPGDSALERMCSRAMACYPGGMGLADCVTWWLDEAGPRGASDRALQRFLATPPGCAGFPTTFPALDPGYPCKPHCVGTWAISGCSRDQILDCDVLGTPCRDDGAGHVGCLPASVAPCGTCDAQGRAIECLGGTVMAAAVCSGWGATCAAPPGVRAYCGEGTCAGNGTDCGGPLRDKVMVCDGATSAQWRTRRSCDLVAQRCGGSLGYDDCTARGDRKLCEIGSGSDCIAAWSESGPLHYLRYCLGGELRFLDCQEQGYAACRTATLTYATEAYCGAAQ